MSPESPIGALPGKKQNNPTDVYVGNRIRVRRKELGFSQEKLGEKVGITFQQIQKYEKGTNRVGASRLQAMATALEVPISYFFPHDPDGKAVDTAEAAILTDNGALKIARDYLRIADPAIRRKAQEIVRAIADTTGAARTPA